MEDSINLEPYKVVWFLAFSDKSRRLEERK